MKISISQSPKADHSKAGRSKSVSNRYGENAENAEVPLGRSHPEKNQRWRDDNKNKICGFEGGGSRGQRGRSSKNTVFLGKRHDNKILKVQIVLSRNFVVIAQTPKKKQRSEQIPQSKNAENWGKKTKMRTRKRANCG